MIMMTNTVTISLATAQQVILQGYYFHGFTQTTKSKKYWRAPDVSRSAEYIIAGSRHFSAAQWLSVACTTNFAALQE